MTVVVFAALVWKVIDFLRLLFNPKTNRSGIITQATAWAGGVALVIIGAHAQLTGNLILPGSDVPLRTLDIWSLVLLGLLISSLASSVVDIKQAIDSSDTSSMPPLVPPAPQPNEPGPVQPMAQP